MKVLSVLLIVGAYIMGAYDGDSTAAVVLTMLLAPVIFERKSRRKKGAGGTFLGGIEVREHR